MAINRLLKNKDEIIQICEKVMLERCDVTHLEEERVKLQTEQDVICSLMERLIAMNAATAVNREEYNRQFAEYEAGYNEIHQRIADLDSEQARYLQAQQIGGIPRGAEGTRPDLTIQRDAVVRHSGAGSRNCKRESALPIQRRIGDRGLDIRV